VGIRISEMAPEPGGSQKGLHFQRPSVLKRGFPFPVSGL